MQIQSIINGQTCRIIEITRTGSTAYVTYLSGTTSAGSLFSTVFQTSSANDPFMVLATSAFYLADPANSNSTYDFLSANTPVFTDANKRLTSVGNSGSGLNVLQDNPVLSAATITGTLTAPNISIITSGTFSMSLSGTSAITSAIAYYATAKNMVNLYIPQLLQASITSAATLSGIPAAIRPVRNQIIQLESINNNGGNYSGIGTLDVSGNITLAIRDSLSVAPNLIFSNVGIKGIGVQTVSYLLN